MTDAQHAGHEQAGEQAKRLPVHLDPSQGEKTRFKPGESGNPKGRAKGTKNLSTQIQAMMNDPKFIDKLSEKVKSKTGIADEEFQGTPMKAIITTAMIEAIDPMNHPKARASARDWLGKFGYGTKIDVTSDGERIKQAPIIVSSIQGRPGDTGELADDDVDELED